MPKYMLMMNAPKNGWETFMAMPQEVVRAHIAFMQAFSARLAQAGELVSAEGLMSPNQARIVRAGARGPRMLPVPRPQNGLRARGGRLPR